MAFKGLQNLDYLIDKWSGFLADLLTIPKIPIKSDNRIKVYGRFVKTDNSIYIVYNKKKFANDHKLKVNVLQTITHEYRHYYQAYCIAYEKEMAEIEGKERIDLWKKDLMNYKPYGSKEYYNQDVEIDSVSFTMMLFLYFDVIVIEDYNIYDENKIDNRLKSLLMDYTKEEVIDSLASVDLKYDVLKDYLIRMINDRKIIDNFWNKINKKKEGKNNGYCKR